VLRCALLRGAGKNTINVLPAPRSSAQSVCERSLSVVCISYNVLLPLLLLRLLLLIIIIITIHVKYTVSQQKQDT